MSNIRVLTTRELNSYFATPIAYVFIVIFLLLMGIFTFYIGNFFQRGQADLLVFFQFHPWIYAIFVPAITMRSWAEERKTGTIELLFSLPISVFDAVFSKFIASWLFTTVALFFTFPIWLAVNYLGNPDNGIILTGYIGSLLMAGGYLAIGTCISALTKNQVVAFVLSLFVCFMLNISGFPALLEYLTTILPTLFVEVLGSLSFLTNYEEISKGIISLKSIVYFTSLITFWLFANIVVIELKKAD